MNIAEIEALLRKVADDEWCLAASDPYQKGYVHESKTGRPVVQAVTAGRDELQLAAAAPDLAHELIAAKKLLGLVCVALRGTANELGECSNGDDRPSGNLQALLAKAEKAAR